MTALALTAAPAGGAGVETPQGGGANNVVLVSTSTDGAAAERAHTQISHVGGNTVASSNIAIAQATACTGCDATAVAVQVVFVTGSPQFFQPANVAVAANGGCTGCGSFAYAWQYLVQTDGPVTLTPGAQQQVQALKQQIDAAAASIVPATLDDDLALQAELDGLTAELKDVIDTQTREVGVGANGAVHRHVATHLPFTAPAGA